MLTEDDDSEEEERVPTPLISTSANAKEIEPVQEQTRHKKKTSTATKDEPVLKRGLHEQGTPQDVTDMKRLRKLTARATRETRKKPVLPIVPKFDRKRRTEVYSVWSIYRDLKHIDLDADYQRGFVWPQHKQNALIESVLHNIDIPKFILSMRRGSAIKVCMDGKQRLTTLRRFMDGEFAFKDLDTGQRWWYCANSDAKRSTRLVLDEETKCRFDNMQLTVVYYDDITIDQERDVFGRVQDGVSLTPAERMRAINSPAADLVRTAEIHIRDIGDPAVVGDRHDDGELFYTLAQLAMLLLNTKLRSTGHRPHRTVASERYRIRFA